MEGAVASEGGIYEGAACIDCAVWDDTRIMLSVVVWDGEEGLWGEGEVVCRAEGEERRDEAVECRSDSGCLCADLAEGEGIREGGGGDEEEVRAEQGAVLCCVVECEGRG